MFPEPAEGNWERVPQVFDFAAGTQTLNKARARNKESTAPSRIVSPLPCQPQTEGLGQSVENASRAGSTPARSLGTDRSTVSWNRGIFSVNS